MAKLSYGDFRPLRKGESGYSPTARRYVSPSTGEILPVRQFQKRAEGSSLNQKAKQSEERRVEKQKKSPPAGGIQKQKKSPPAGTPAKRNPTISKSGKAGKKNLGQHISKQYDQKGNIRRVRINTRTAEGMIKQLNRANDGQGIIIHLVGSNGSVIKAVGPGRKHTSNAGELKQKIAANIAAGMSSSDAMFSAIGESFAFYDENGDYVNDISDYDFSNIIMYIEPL